MYSHFGLDRKLNTISIQQIPLRYTVATTAPQAQAMYTHSNGVPLYTNVNSNPLQCQRVQQQHRLSPQFIYQQQPQCLQFAQQVYFQPPTAIPVDIRHSRVPLYQRKSSRLTPQVNNAEYFIVEDNGNGVMVARPNNNNPSSLENKEDNQNTRPVSAPSSMQAQAPPPPPPDSYNNGKDKLHKVKEKSSGVALAGEFRDGGAGLLRNLEKLEKLGLEKNINNNKPPISSSSGKYQQPTPLWKPPQSLQEKQEKIRQENLNDNWRSGNRKRAGDKDKEQKNKQEAKYDECEEAYADNLKYEPISDDDNFFDEELNNGHNSQCHQGARADISSTSINDGAFDAHIDDGCIAIKCASIVDGMGKLIGNDQSLQPPPFPNSVIPADHKLLEEATGIRDVWSHNLYQEFTTIRRLREKYPIVAMDTEFPGVVLRPTKAQFNSPQEYQFQLLRLNCMHLRLIQLGITLFDEDGKTPPPPNITTWQFNFKFSLENDMYAADSIELLQNSGVQFDKLEEEGIDPFVFAEYLLSSGLVLNEDIKWVSFHSGYDFGYLLGILTNRALPETESEFFETLQIYFPFLYDVKYLMKCITSLRGGLQDVADDLSITRLGCQHQAGSDSLVTGRTFFKIKEGNEDLFKERIDRHLNGRVFGLSMSYDP